MSAQAEGALRLLCELLEHPEARISPDVVRYSGDTATFQHLRALSALGTDEGICSPILCSWCGDHDLLEVQRHGDAYRGYCTECGWVALTVQDVTPLRVDGGRIARWLAAALGLARKHRYQPEEQVYGLFWRLGEVTLRRKSRVVFFGRRLDDSALIPAVIQHMGQTCAPGKGVIITSTTVVTPELTEAGHAVVPLRSVATLRKAGFVIDGLAAYWGGPTALEPPTKETSLRLLRSARVALIDGERKDLSPQVFTFLCMIDDADGEPVHKRELADGLEISVDAFKGAEIFKRHKDVYQTFVDHDRKGRYWRKSPPPA